MSKTDEAQKARELRGGTECPVCGGEGCPCCLGTGLMEHCRPNICAVLEELGEVVQDPVAALREFLELMEE